MSMLSYTQQTTGLGNGKPRQAKQYVTGMTVSQHPNAKSAPGTRLALLHDRDTPTLLCCGGQQMERKTTKEKTADQQTYVG